MKSIRRLLNATIAVTAMVLAPALTATAQDTLVALGKVSSNGTLEEGASSIGANISVTNVGTGNRLVKISKAGAFTGAHLSDFQVHTSCYSRDHRTRASVAGVAPDLMTIRVRIADVESSADPDEASAANNAFDFYVRRIDEENPSGKSRCLVSVGRIGSDGTLLSHYSGEGATVTSTRIGTGSYRLNMWQPGGYGNNDSSFVLLSTGNGSNDKDRAAFGRFSVDGDGNGILQLYVGDEQSAVNTTVAQPADGESCYVVYRISDEAASSPADSAMLLGATGFTSAGGPRKGFAKPGYAISTERGNPGIYFVYIRKRNAFAGRSAEEFAPIATISASGTVDEIALCSAWIEDPHTLRIDVYIQDVEKDGDPDGTLVDSGVFVSVYEAKGVSKPDAKIGLKSGSGSHRGDDVYRPSGSGQAAKVKLRKGSGRFFFSVENDGNVTDRLRLRQAGAKKLVKTKYYRVTGARSNITSLVRTGRLSGTGLSPESSLVFEARMRQRQREGAKVSKLRISSQYEAAGPTRDGVMAKVVPTRG